MASAAESMSLFFDESLLRCIDSKGNWVAVRRMHADGLSLVSEPFEHTVKVARLELVDDDGVPLWYLDTGGSDSIPLTEGESMTLTLSVSKR
jgi:hypothetical protein